MKKSFFSVILLSFTLALGSVSAFADHGRKHIHSGRKQNLDTGEPAPARIDPTLEKYSYIVPFLPKGTKQIYQADEAGPCYETSGVVVKGARSSWGCRIFTSSEGAFKIQVFHRQNVWRIPRIWKKVRVDGQPQWVRWVEFDGNNNAIYESEGATQLARINGIDTPAPYEQPITAQERPRNEPGVPEIPMPNLGSILEGLIRKTR